MFYFVISKYYSMSALVALLHFTSNNLDYFISLLNIMQNFYFKKMLPKYGVQLDYYVNAGRGCQENH